MYDGVETDLIDWSFDIFFFMFYVCRGIQLPFRRPDFQEAIFLLSHHHLHTWMHVGHRFLGQVSKICVYVNVSKEVHGSVSLTQCARTNLNKRFLPKPMTTTG